MRAAVIYEHGGPGAIRLESGFPDPRPEDGCVVVRVRATSLNYHDVVTRRGMPGIKVPMPCIMGLDFAGDIVEVGARVEGFTPGDRVLIDPVDRVGAGGLIGEMWHGGLAELARVPAHHLVPLPADVSYEAAACLPVAYGTALRMMYTIGKVKAGDKVLILGASGGVGTCCVQLAKNAGCEVIACTSSPEKLERLKGLGADVLIDYDKQDYARVIYEKYGKPHRRRFTGGVDVVVNYTGGESWVPSLKVLRRQGKLLTCGATAGFDPREDLRFIWTFELQVLGANGWMRDELVALLDLVRRGSIAPVIDTVFGLEDANAAFALLEERRSFGKVLIRP